MCPIHQNPIKTTHFAAPKSVTTAMPPGGRWFICLKKGCNTWVKPERDYPVAICPKCRYAHGAEGNPDVELVLGPGEGVKDQSSQVCELRWVMLFAMPGECPMVGNGDRMVSDRASAVREDAGEAEGAAPHLATLQPGHEHDQRRQ